MAIRSVAQQEAGERLLDLVGPCRVRFCPCNPTAKQEAFLRLQELEVLWGGSVGGGKTIGLAMAALMYADVPGYHALLVRTSLTELQLPGGLMSVLSDWLAGTKAVWSGDKHAWLFPGPGRRAGSGGASVGFGYLDGLGDLGRYQGSNFSFVGFDELVRFSQQQYGGMFRVLRQPADRSAMVAATDGTTLADVPVRVRATSNPGGPYADWVKTHFVDPVTRPPGVIFLRSRLDDNPHLDRDSYLETLGGLPLSLRRRLIEGDWDATDEGELFREDWFPIIHPRELPPMTNSVRYWDLAGTERSVAAPDPDYTVGLKLERDTDKTLYITDIVRERKAPGAIERLVAETAKADGHQVQIVIEQEPGASGKAVIARYMREILAGYWAGGDLPSGPKNVRAHPVASACQNGLVKIVRGPNMREFLDEVCAFPHAPHDDCVDALAGAHNAITQGGRRYRPSRPRGRIPGVPYRRIGY